MIKISNTRTLHSVENESEYLGLRGEVQFSEERIVSFSGQFHKLPVAANNETVIEEDVMVDNYCGDFYFNENTDGLTVNKSINSIPTDLHTYGCDLLEATVAELHEYKEKAMAEKEPEAEA